jgi:hypothetical protein
MVHEFLHLWLHFLWYTLVEWLTICIFSSGTLAGEDYISNKKCGDKGTIGRPCSKKR